MKATALRCSLDGVNPVYTVAEDDALGQTDFLSFWRREFSVNVISETYEEFVFELIGVDAPIANALRRILLAEVPTIAIETVFIKCNTSILQDEVLAHRLGLIPLDIDPRLFEFIEKGVDATDLNTVVFRLKAEGASGASVSNASALEGDADAQSNFTNVYASSLVWDPQGAQLERLPRPAAPVHGDILLAKLAPGQSIEFEAHAVKGIGKEHAKWSPVATASYKLHTRVKLSETAPFEEDEADALVKQCPMGVFDIEELASGTRRAVVARPRDCTVCRECLRPQGWEDRVAVERVTSHYIFSVESTGCLSARELVSEALKVLAEKARALVNFMDENRGLGATADGTRGHGGIPFVPAAAAAARAEAAMRNPEEEGET